MLTSIIVEWFGVLEKLKCILVSPKYIMNKWIIKFLRRLKSGHLRFLELKLKKLMSVPAYTTANVKLTTLCAISLKREV